MGQKINKITELRRENRAATHQSLDGVSGVSDDDAGGEDIGVHKQIINEANDDHDVLLVRHFYAGRCKI